MNCTFLSETMLQRDAYIAPPHACVRTSMMWLLLEQSTALRVQRGNGTHV
jgi:hypothetical protein